MKEKAGIGALLQTFKKPLSKDEELHYLTLSRNGDIDARNTLVEYNLRLVAHIVKKYISPERDMDDLISIGTIGLIKAINTYNVEKGNRLVTYASRCIENEILMLLRQEKKNQKDISLYEPIGTDKEGNEISLLDIIDNQEESISSRLIEKENIKKLYDYLPGSLSPQEYDVIRMRYGIGGYQAHTQKDVAAKLNISRSYVSRIEKKALGKLRKALE